MTFRPKHLSVSSVGLYVCAQCGCDFAPKKPQHTYRYCSKRCSTASRYDGPAARIAAKSTPEPNTGCYLYLGRLNNQGYGVLHVDGKKRYAHRVVWEQENGQQIPDGKQIDHLCRTRSCVNPDHLELVTPQENMLRGMAPSAITVRLNICKRGHVFDADNTYVTPSGDRRCRACVRSYQAQKRAEKRRSNVAS